MTACAFGLVGHRRKAGWLHCPLLSGAGEDPSPLGPSSIPRLKDLFYRSSNLQYFKRLIQIPQLPEVSVPGQDALLEADRMNDKV